MRPLDWREKRRQLRLCPSSHDASGVGIKPQTASIRLQTDTGAAREVFVSWVRSV